jgi:hypothetical protein
MREAVRDVAKHFPTAIVTGRCVEKVTHIPASQQNLIALGIVRQHTCSEV